MSFRCDVCGKGPLGGNSVSHAKNRTKRRFLPNLKRVRAMDPAVAVGYLFSGRLRDAVARAESAGARTILPRRDRVTPKLIADAGRRGLQVVTWTVNDPKQMKRLMALGVDGIMSNFPDRLAAVAGGQ